MRWRIVPAVVLAGVLVASCSDSPVVAEVNGDPITAAQVDALSTETPEDPAIPGQPFRDALGLLIVNAAMRTAAEELFGATGLDDPDLLAARIADPPNEREVIVFRNIAADERLTEAFAMGAAENYAIRDAVIAVIATGQEADEQELDALFFAWRAEAVEAADVWVRSQVGEWGGLAGGVLPPP